MSASEQPDNGITIEIDGVSYPARKGQMLIEVADANGIAIPRFCYHEKLSVAANCRMCLVEVEKAPKPLPACATPVNDGMVVRTRSPLARRAQQNVMEFLLINHPLDCPICDQGGECELQDVSMGYGRSDSRYADNKRAVPDRDVGPLVATIMTRCIHCTRCVRFLDEIAGTHEMGGIGRGDRTEIGTFIQRSIDSELSGNIIDICPVGALTNKPFQYSARAWEMRARESVGLHDGLQSRLYYHVKNGRIKRAVPRHEEAVNENWLADRDRYSHFGLQAEDRLTRPMIRKNGKLEPVSWEEGLQQAAAWLKDHENRLAGAIHPSASCEEHALFHRLVQALGGQEDFRLDIQDASDRQPPRLFDVPVEQVEKQCNILLLGCNPRAEMPLLNHRIRKAARQGARIGLLDVCAHALNYDAQVQTVADLPAAVAACSEALGEPVTGADLELDAALKALLTAEEKPLVIAGEGVYNHPHSGWMIRQLRRLADAGRIRLNLLSAGGNAHGASLARGGVLANLPALLENTQGGWMLYQVEPEQDLLLAGKLKAQLEAGAGLLALASYLSPWLEAHAEVVLPLAHASEQGGLYVNVDGLQAETEAATAPPGQAQAGWRVLRALGGTLELAGFDFNDRAAARALFEQAAGSQAAVDETDAAMPEAGEGVQWLARTPIYHTDATVRRSGPLQETRLAAEAAQVRMHPETADVLSLGNTQFVKLPGGELRLCLDEGMAQGVVCLPRGVPQSSGLNLEANGVQLEAVQ